MTRAECTAAIEGARVARGLGYRGLAAAIGRSPVWTTSALMGQARMTPEEASAAADLLGLGEEVVSALQTFPSKGSLGPGPPTDPLIYRFHEIVQVYGTTLKALIHEEFGDGIMSAIDFTMDIERVPNPAGDRVKVTMEGKFLPYRVW